MFYLSRLYLDVCVLVYIYNIYIYINVLEIYFCTTLVYASPQASTHCLLVIKKTINFVLRCPTLIVVSSLLYVHPTNVIMSLVNEHFAWGKPPASVLPNPADLCC